MSLHAAVESAWLQATEGSDCEHATSKSKTTEVKKPKYSLPTEAELGPMMPKAKPAAKNLHSPILWGGLHRALSVHDTMNTEVAPTQAPAAEPANLSQTTVVEATEMGASTAATIVFHDFAGRARSNRASRDRTDSTSSTCSWMGISASLEDDVVGSSTHSPFALRHAEVITTSSPKADAAPASSVAAPTSSGSELSAQTTNLRRPPKSLSKSLQPTTIATTPWCLAGEVGEMLNINNNPSPSPQKRRPSREAEAKVVRESVNDDADSKENAFVKAPPSYAFGYSDLSPLALLSH